MKRKEEAEWEDASLGIIQDRIKKARMRAEERKMEKAREAKAKSFRVNNADDLVLPELDNKRSKQ